MPAITRFVLRHKLLVLILWILTAVAGAVTAGTTTSRLSTSFQMPGAAFRTDAQIMAIYHNGATDPTVPVITLPAGTTVRTPGVVDGLDRAFRAAAGGDARTRVVDYANTGDRAFVTADGRSSYALVFTPSVGGFGANPAREAVAGAVRAAAAPGWRVQVTGVKELTASKPAAKGNGVLVESMLGGVGALAVLAFVFASFLALLPLVVAGISILTTFLAVLGLTQITGISQIVEFLIALIGLGVAIDYSLLVVTRWREERAHGRDNIAAVEAAMRSAGRAVLFSGVTVAIGLLALVVLPVPFLRSVGYGGVLIPVISVGVAVTLLPVLLATVGPRLDWPRLRTENTAGRGWTGWARLTVRRRGIAAVLGMAALGALIVPALSLSIGEPRTDALAQSGPAHDALGTLTAGGVPSGVLTPITVLAASQQSATITHQLAGLPGVDAAVAPSSADARRAGTVLITVLPVAETNVGAGQHTVRAVRGAIAQDTGAIGVDGSGASTLDFAHDVYGNFPLMLALIALATFVLLARAFRSLVLPAKAVLLNLASLAAAYGVMVLVWQQGHLSHSLWGIPATGSITMWVPVMVFAFLFGLSMDYEVFILARMREAYDATGSTETAVVQGIGRTGRLVTSAALILFLSFVAMSTGPETDIKVLATGLGAGILIDATVVRCLLVPALVSLFGGYNWWLPGWAARLLRVPPSPLRPAGPGEGVQRVLGLNRAGRRNRAASRSWPPSTFRAMARQSAASGSSTTAASSTACQNGPPGAELVTSNQASTSSRFAVTTAGSSTCVRCCAASQPVRNSAKASSRSNPTQDNP
ncbi:MAG TPA: MMPL family transporter [Mycobacteriales bacterium]|nr:MMPL family transporter [Mycobacteriales bacterium]